MSNLHSPTHPSLSRRHFLQSSTLAGAWATLSVSGLAGQSSATGRYNTAPDWYEKPMRWLTMNLVQDDPGKFDPDFWLDYVRRCHVDAASWNSGGIIAFYPTEIPYHKRNERIGNTDPLGYLVEGCRKQGIIVTARVDHHATYEDGAKAHPEWISRDLRGEPRRHWAMPELYLTCTLGSYNYDFMTAVMKEIVTKYRVDGFNHNRWSPQLMCYCDYCRTTFRRHTGLELPAKEDAQDANWQKYLLWREDRIFELWDHWNAEIAKINPHAFVLPGIGAERDRLNMSKVRRRAHTLYLDYQGRRGLAPPWMAGKKGKELRAVLGTKPVGLTFSVGVEDAYRWKDSVQSDAELRVWVAEGVANGLRPKVAKFAGTLHDRRWLRTVEEIYTWQWRHEKYLRNVGHPVANVAMLYSQQTARFYAAQAESSALRESDDYSLGFYHALIEARIPFEVVHEDLLAESDLDRFKLLVLPNVAALSDKQCQQLRQFVARGGSLVATYESSLYDERGRRRKDFGLADLFGVSVTGPTQGPMRNSYLRVNRATSHPILAGLEEAGRLINGVYRVPVKPAAQFPVQPLFFVAPYPDLPMEEVYPRDLDKNVAELYLRETGPSRIVYFPFDIDRTFWEVLNVDHGRLLANAVRWAGGRPPVEVTGPGVIDVTVWRQAASLTVHLVNLSNPMMMKGPLRELIPLPAQHVRVQLPEGKRPKQVHLLSGAGAGGAARYELAGGWLKLTVPSILLHEVIAIDL